MRQSPISWFPTPMDGTAQPRLVLPYFLPQYLNFQYFIFLATYRLNFLSKDYLLSIFFTAAFQDIHSTLYTHYNDLVNIGCLQEFVGGGGNVSKHNFWTKK
jgi:hypothetical protein